MKGEKLGRIFIKDCIEMENRNMLIENEKVMHRWREKELHLSNSTREANISCWGMEKEGERIVEQKGIMRKETLTALRKVRRGKSFGTSGIIAIC